MLSPYGFLELTLLMPGSVQPHSLKEGTSTLETN